MTSMYLYWMTRLDAFNSVNSVIGCISGVMCVGGAIAWLITVIIKNINERFNKDGYIDSDWSEANSIQNAIRRPLMVSIFVFLLTTIISIFVPTTKEMVAIDIVPKICNNEQLKDINKDILDIAQCWLKEIKNAKNAENK